MCWFHGENGTGDRYRGSELKTGEVFGLVDQVAPYKPKIYIGGSEPFIHKDFLLVLEHIKSRDIKVSFATNGTLLDPAKAEQLVKIGVDDIKFSIDGSEELHDYIRGKGVFRKVTGAIRTLSGVRKREAKSKPSITVNTTITSRLPGELKNTVDAIRDATGDSADFYRLHHLWYVTRKELSMHQSATGKTLGCKATGAGSHLTRLSGSVDPEVLAGEICHLRKNEKVVFFPDLGYEDIVKYYSEGAVLDRSCRASFSGALIKPNGDVKFCPDEWIDDYVVGNIREDSFNDIWNNKRAREFRKILLKQKQFAGCKRCSWMYSY